MRRQPSATVDLPDPLKPPMATNRGHVLKSLHGKVVVGTRGGRQPLVATRLLRLRRRHMRRTAARSAVKKGSSAKPSSSPPHRNSGWRRGSHGPSARDARGP